MQNSELETKRLILRPLRMEDADQTQRLFPYWDVVKFLNTTIPWPYPFRLNAVHR
jgi:ribosomal-protein-alanine N-acetyltransferase